MKKAAAVAKEKPKLPNLDPQDASIWQAVAKNAQEGSVKLARIVDTFREALQTMVVAEYDRVENRPVSAADLRGMAIAALDAYSRETGQDWRRPRNQVIHTRVGKADHDQGKNRGLDGSDYD